MRFPFVLAWCLLWSGPAVWSQGRQLSGQYAPAGTPALPPAEAQERFTVPEGFEVRLFAAEPDVIAPVAMTWDERGRLWVVELYEYPLGAAPGSEPRDRVKILEDTTGDGRADKVTVFAEGLNLATGILAGYGGVFVGQAPHLLFLEDTTGDDRADKRTVVMTGFGLEDTHELLNGFTWGPDGWLYMTHGVFTHSKVRNPDSPEDEPDVIMNAAVARWHPITRTFEVFADGTSNPWGVDFDRYGNAFISACVIDHLFHMAPGGIYVRQSGNPAHPYAYQLLPSIVDHRHFRAAYAGIQIYQGDQYPEEYRGTVFMGNIHDNSVHQDILTPNGSSFTASFKQDFLRANDGWFRPVSQQVGPDGALWIMDWHDKYPCYQNARADPEGVDREHGRIWRVVHTGDQPGRPVPTRTPGLDLGAVSSRELVAFLSHPNVWHRRTAQRLLSERRDPQTRVPLENLVREGQTLEARLAALWTLHGSGQLRENTLDRHRSHPDPAVRAWVARLTGERGNPSAQAMERLEQLAEDAAPSVRLAVATAARQFLSGSLTINTPPGPERSGGELGSVLATLVYRSSDAQDPLIPFMVWMAAEPLLMSDTEGALDWLAEHGPLTLPLSAQLIRKGMRRLCDTRDPLQLDLALRCIARIASRSDALTLAALDGLIEGQQGKALPPASPPGPLLTTLSRHSNRDIVNRAHELGSLWGDDSALRELILRVQDPSARTEERMAAIQAVRQLPSDSARAALLEVVSGSEPDLLVIEAIRAVAMIGGENVDQALISRWGRFSSPARQAAAEALASRGPWSAALLSAVESGAIAAAEIPVTVIRSLAQAGDEGIRERTRQVIGRVRPPDTDKLALIAEKKEVVLNGPVDLRAGHQVARQSCLVCHKLHGEGFEVGPDLTGVGRPSVDALLAHIIDPNQIIGLGYENVLIETRDGRSLSGRMVEQTDARVRLIATGGIEEVVARSDIESLRVSELSVMPEGLEQMPDEDFRNMVWYILNPPQDQKPISVELRHQELVVLARLPGQTEPVELVHYVMDPGLRPYLHPVRDPAGTVTLTQDRPSDHVWQHGIFTGLHHVNGVDFWTERQGRQRFVRLLDVHQEQDHVSWRSLTEWVGPDGQKLLEEEQAVRVHRVDASSQYRMDFDWLLRAGERAVQIGRHDYGGLAVRMVFDPSHDHLNSAGQRGKDTAGQRAAWCNVSRAFDGQTFGIAVFDHPANQGYPSAWRVDAQGLINPSPSRQGDWSIPSGQARLFRYRLLVHRGAGDPAQLEAERQRFEAIPIATAQIPDLPVDGESVALWNPLWRVNAPLFEGTPQKLADYAGRKNVLVTHPFDQVRGAALERVVEIPSTGPAKLRVTVASHERGDWELRVLANDRLLRKLTVNRQGGTWKELEVDLSPLAGETVRLRLENAANNWHWEFAYWGGIELDLGSN